MIEVKHLKKEFKNFTPLKDVSFSVQKGDIVSIIGPSGTGKSTLLRCINLLEKPSSGHVYIDGEEITNTNANIIQIRKKIGMVFQNFNLFKNKNVLENVSVALIDVLGKSKEEAENEAKIQLEKVGLLEKIDAYPSQLSGGQQQRVAIARSIAMKPKVLLLDEPTSALDPSMIGEVLLVIKKLAQEKMTMIIVTHEFDFAQDISSKIIYLDEGIVYEQGSPKRIFDNPQKEKTKMFVNNFNELNDTLLSSNFDYIRFINRIDNFCKHYLIADKLNKKIQFICEAVVDEIFKVNNYDDIIKMRIVYQKPKNKIKIKFAIEKKKTFLFKDNEFIFKIENFSGVEQSISFNKENNCYLIEYIVNCYE